MPDCLEELGVSLEERGLGSRPGVSSGCIPRLPVFLIFCPQCRGLG